MRVIWLLVAALVTACVPPPSPVATQAPMQRIRVPADYNIESRINDEYERGLTTQRKVHVTSNPRSLISEDIVRQEIVRSAAITLAEPPAADVIIEIQSYHVEISDDDGATETLLVDKSRVGNFWGAALLMPDSSTYSVDLQKQSISALYEVAYTIQRAGSPGSTPHVARDRLEMQATKCSQPKIINAFGGVSAADFWANDQLKALCTTGGPGISRQTAQVRVERDIGQAIRKEILSKPVANAAAPASPSTTPVP